MSEFDKNLLYSSEIMDTLLKPFGGVAPKKRLLQIDYKENSIDKNISVAVYQNVGMSDEVMIAELVKVYAQQNKIISSIVEVNQNSQFMGVIYMTPEFLEECMTEALKIFHRKGSGDEL